MDHQSTDDALRRRRETERERRARETPEQREARLSQRRLRYRERARERLAAETAEERETRLATRIEIDVLRNQGKTIAHQSTSLMLQFCNESDLPNHTLEEAWYKLFSLAILDFTFCNFTSIDTTTFSDSPNSGS